MKGETAVAVDGFAAVVHDGAIESVHSEKQPALNNGLDFGLEVGWQFLTVAGRTVTAGAEDWGR